MASVPSPLCFCLFPKRVCVSSCLWERQQRLRHQEWHWMLPVAQLLAVMCIYLGVINTSSGWLSGRLPTTSVDDVPTLEMKWYNFASSPCTLLARVLCTRSLLFYLVLPVSLSLSQTWFGIHFSLSNALCHTGGWFPYSSSGLVHWLKAGLARRESVQWALQDHREGNIYLEYTCGRSVAMSSRRKKKSQMSAMQKY